MGIAPTARRLLRATDRAFAELNLWQRIFAEHWAGFVATYQAEHERAVPEHWEANVRKMLACADIRQGYYKYACPHCEQTRKVAFTCKSWLCLRCFYRPADGLFERAQQVLFKGVVHRQVLLTVTRRDPTADLGRAEVSKSVCGCAG